MKETLKFIFLFICSFAVVFVVCIKCNSDTQRKPVQQQQVVKQDTCKPVIDSLKTKLFLSNYKIEKVKYYLSLVDKKPSQIKYLKGWIRRAVQ